MADEARPTFDGAIDPALARRLLGRAERAGVSDPGHGRALAGRLQRASAVPLADEVARRYGAAALAGDRPPIVHATPRAPEPPAIPSREASAPASAQTRPVVRAAERPAGPAFPPVRPLASAAVIQRSVDPAALPVVSPTKPRSSRTAESAVATASTVQSAANGAAMPVVAAPASMLRRTIATERAEAGRSAAAPVPRVVVSRSASAVSGSALVQRSPVRGDSGRSEGRASHASPSPGSPLPVTSGSAPKIVQRSSDSDAGAARNLPNVAPRTRTADASPAVVQRTTRSGAAPSPAARQEQSSAVTTGDALPVVRAASVGAVGAGVIQRSPMADEKPMVHAKAARSAAESVTAVTEGAPRVQRAMTEPPAGAPPVEMPTVTAPGAQAAGDSTDVGRIADRVYEVLVRRLSSERKQRGW